MSDIVEYHGYPQLPDQPDEESKWQKFLNWICPWLKDKAKLGDQLLNAELQNKHLQNEKLKAETIHKYMDALKKKEEIENIRLQNMEKRRALAEDPEKFDKEESARIRERITDNIKTLQLLKNGAILDVEIGKEENVNKETK